MPHVYNLSDLYQIAGALINSFHTPVSITGANAQLERKLLQKTHDEPNEPILGYYCTCKTGSRTLGICAHVPSVLWYLGSVPVDEQVHVNEKEKDRSLVPFCRGLDLIPSYPSLLDLNQIVFINAHLPQQYQLEWRFLFSSEIHGESFSTLIGRIVNQGPSVLIVEDKNGYMFGGFAPANWELSPKFYGDDSSFLFTLAPRMRVFPSTGYNQHFQYLNLHQQTLPNGLAMGGQHGYWGLWIDSEYGKGETSQSCTTYTGYQQMSLSKEFTFRHLEVWGLGQPPPTPQEKGERVGILDGNVESKAILKMAGKTMYSEFVKEPPPV
nr:TLD domain-containing protein 1 [Leptinotarsa decemlineata]